jgi:hypothetical protein
MAAAFSQNILPNLVDWARSVDPNGAIADIAELLSQCNEHLKDMIWSFGTFGFAARYMAWY